MALGPLIESGGSVGAGVSVAAAEGEAVMRKMPRHCPQCGVKMTHAEDCRQLRTRDHILPKFRGGRNSIHGGTRNLRIMCQECNELTAKCGQCIAAMHCGMTVARDTGTTARAVLVGWRIGYVPVSEVRL